MAINKVISNGEVVIDLTEDTAVEETVLQGETFHLANGEQAVGTLEQSSGGVPISNFVNNGEFRLQNLTSIELDDSITSLGYEAFKGCSWLTSITIPASVMSIGDMAFQLCRGLTSIIIPDNVMSIGDGAFGDCSRLTSITIPDSVTSIGNDAFLDCSGLTEVTIESIVPPTFGTDMFSGCEALTTIYVPAESVEAYKAASGWSDYANIIQAIQ